MTSPNLDELAARVEHMGMHQRLRFSVCNDTGWITSDSQEVIRTLCDLYNNRAIVALALREHISSKGPDR